MKARAFLCSVVFMTVTVVSGTSRVNAETSRLVPESCTAVVTISDVAKDSGVSWLLNAWINSPRKSPLRDFLDSVETQEMSVAIFPQKSGSSLSLLLVIDVAEESRVQREKLNRVILPEEGTEVNRTSYRGTDIYHVAPENKKEDFVAYCMRKNQILIGTDADVLKMAVDGPSVTENNSYRKAKGQFSSNQDGILFADNSGLRFVSFLRPLEEKWKMTLLLSSEHLAWMGSSFDVVDSTRVSGKIVFQGVDTSHIEDIQDDAEFMGEAFKRKFIAEKIEYFSDVEVEGRTVSLNFQIEGIEPLWLKLFEQGVLSLIRPE
jgi:hypothetical protein